MLYAKPAGLCLPGLLWSLAAISSAQSVTFTGYLIPTPASNPNYITAGPDGALWFSELAANQIGRVTTAGVFTEYGIPTPKRGPYGITAGPDGALWFVEYNGNNIGRITTAGAIAEYAIPTPASGPLSITAGPDGALWFVEYGGNNIGRITAGGVIAEYALPAVLYGSNNIAAGPDGALWFAEYGGSGNSSAKIGRINMAGVVTEYALPASITAPYAIAPAGIRGHHPRRHLQGALADRAVLQGFEAEPEHEDLCRDQRKRPAHPDLDSPDRAALAQMAASPLAGQLVLVQSGLPAAAEPVHLPRVDQVAQRSDGNAAVGSVAGTTYAGARMIWTGPHTSDPETST
jgi:hypothetical protein